MNDGDDLEATVKASCGLRSLSIRRSSGGSWQGLGARDAPLRAGGPRMAKRFAAEAGALEDLVLVRVEERLRTALHEIRQPVAAVMALAEAARGLPGISTDMREYLDLLIEQVQEVSGAAWSVLGRGRAEDLPGSLPVDVDEILDSVLAAFSRTWTGTLVRRGHSGGHVDEGVPARHPAMPGQRRRQRRPSRRPHRRGRGHCPPGRRLGAGGRGGRRTRFRWRAREAWVSDWP